MPQRSAGVLLYRYTDTRELLLLVAHPGGPYFARKDLGAWSMPKGLLEEGEDALTTAKREFLEETGHPAPAGPYIDLGEVRLKSGKYVRGFAAEGALDENTLQSNLFELEWPRASGRMQRYPEIDRVAWLAPDDARAKLNVAQAAFVDRLVAELATPR